MRTTKFHEDREQEIIETAKRLFLEHGIEHTTISMIVNEIGVAHGLIYYYFKSKEKLVEKVLESILSDFENRLTVNLDIASGSFYIKLGLLIRALYEVYYSNESNPKPEEWIRIYYHDQVTKVLSEFGRALLEEGIKEGFITIPNPELVLSITLGGSMLLLEKKKITCKELIVIVFQILALPQGEEIADAIALRVQ